MITVRRTSTGEEYTGALGAGLASLLMPGDVVALEGDLGAGKTTLVRAIAQGLGVNTGLVSSPTFVFINQYPVSVGTLAGGQLVHVDAYRLGGVEDLETLGWDVLFDPATRRGAGKNAAMIEWARRIEEALPADVVWVRLSAQGVSERGMEFEFPDAWGARAGFEWFRDREPIACRITGRWVPPTAKTYPFADERARDADLYRWFSGGYTASRPLRPEDEEA